MPDFDIVIRGAGPVGSTLALLLAQHCSNPSRIAIMDRGFAMADNKQLADNLHFDPRILALNYGSRQLLEQLHAWPDTQANIHTVHVSQQGRLGRTVIRDTDMAVPYLGSVVTYDFLRRFLHQQLALSKVTQLTSQSRQSDYPKSYLEIQSDGTRTDGLRRTYRQVAIIGNVTASRPGHGWAYERFTSQGPLAFLPHPDGKHVYGAVLCCHPETANHLMTLDDNDYARALQSRFGERLGTLHMVGPRHLFPLALHAGPQQLGTRQVAIGNAAQTLHPVAGQGLNLGLRDAAQLATCLIPWLEQAHTGLLPPLHEFSHQRQSDRWLTMGVTDFLSRIFATANPLIQHACGLGLLATDLFVPLQKPLARHLLYGLRS